MDQELKLDYRSFRVLPSTHVLGAELLDIDLSQPLTALQIADLKDALARYQVIFFRDQQLDHDSHKNLGRHFGSLAIHSAVAGIADHPEVVAIHADANSKFVAGEKWHSDLSADAEPPLGSILYLPIVPPVGGATRCSPVCTPPTMPCLRG